VVVVAVVVVVLMLLVLLVLLVLVLVLVLVLSPSAYRAALRGGGDSHRHRAGGATLHGRYMFHKDPCCLK